MVGDKNLREHIFAKFKFLQKKLLIMLVKSWLNFQQNVKSGKILKVESSKILKITYLIYLKVLY